MIAPRMLLKSWAMPPASVPTASMRCDCRSWASRACRSASARLRSSAFAKISADGAQQRDVVVGPALLRLHRIEPEQTDPPARAPHGEAKPGADAALRRGQSFSGAGGSSAHRGNMDRALLDEALEARRPVAAGRSPGALPALAMPGTPPSVRSVRGCCSSAPRQKDVSAIDSGVLAELHERLKDALVDAVGRKIDELR